MRAALRSAAGAVSWILLAFVGLSILIRLTLRDEVPTLATLYYGMPPALSGLLLAAVAGIQVLRGRLRSAAVVCSAALLLAAWQAEISWQVHDKAPGSLKVLSWNTQRGIRGWDRLGAEIGAFDADVVCLIESQEAEHRLPQTLPGYEWRWFPEGLAAGLRGTIRDSEFLDFGAEGRAAVLRAVVKGRPLTLMIVDLEPDPFNPRREGFARLDELRARVKPDLIAGDFNTPRDSVFFQSWRRGLRHAFEAAGNGLDLTWPMPLPLLSIDHVWCGPRLVPRSCLHEGSTASDHRAVVAELDWSTTDEAAEVGAAGEEGRGRRSIAPGRPEGSSQARCSAGGKDPGPTSSLRFFPRGSTS